MDWFASGLSCVFKEFAKVFQIFATGTPVQSPYGVHMLRGTIAGVVHDEAAQMMIWGFKGSGGTKPCWQCWNLTSKKSQRAEAQHNPGRILIDLACGDPSRFVPQTNENIFRLVDELKNWNGSPGDFKQREIDYGIRFEKHGILADPVARAMVPVMDVCWWEPAHVLISIFNWGVYRLFNHLENNSPNLGWKSFQGYLELDWQLVRNGSGRPCTAYTRNLWFADARIGASVSRKEYHGDMGDSLAFFTVLHFFVLTVVAPIPEFAEHAKCMSLLCKIMEIVFAPFVVVHRRERHAEFKRLAVEHFNLNQRLYPDRDAIPKEHYIFHLTG